MLASWPPDPGRWTRARGRWPRSDLL